MKVRRMLAATAAIVIGLLCANAEAVSGDLLFEFQKPSHVVADKFGYSMASIGENVLISAPFDDQAGSGAGAVYMYDGSGQLLRTFLNPTPYSGPAGSEFFGRGLGSLGNSVLIGDHWDSSVVANGGAAYMLDATTGQLQQTFLNPSGVGTSGTILEGIEGFGQSVAGVETDKVLVGAWNTFGEDGKNYGAAYSFNSSTAELLDTFLSPTPQQFSRFGYAVVGIGDKVAISQPCLDRPEVGVNNSGAVHIFDANTGEYLRTLFDPTPSTNNEQFGCNLAALGDNLLIGGGRGVYVFDPDSGALTLSIEDPVVFRVMVAAVGDDILVGDMFTGNATAEEPHNIGRALVFDGTTGELLLTIENPTPEAWDYFGRSMAAVGNDIAVGAVNDNMRGTHSGAAYLFEGIPEPATLSLLLMGGLAILRRRRGRR